MEKKYILGYLNINTKIPYGNNKQHHNPSIYIGHDNDSTQFHQNKQTTMKVKIVKLKNIFEETDHYLVIENEKTGERYTEKKTESVAQKIENVINGKLDTTTTSETPK